MPATGASRGHLVYHWRHGWIPRDHFAALSKAHGSHKGAAKLMEKHGISGGHHSERTHPLGAAATGAKPKPGSKYTLERTLPDGTVKQHSTPMTPKEASIFAGYALHDNVGMTKGDAQKAVGKHLENIPVGQHIEAGGYKFRLVPQESAGAKLDPHAARAAQLRDLAAKKRAEADQIANGVGAPDRAGAMLRAKDSQRMNQRMDSGLRRFTEKQRQAKALESKAHLADGRAKTAAEKQAASKLALTPSKMSPGDLIQHKGSAHMVTKVNRTTVSVPSIVGGPWEDKLPLGQVSKHVKVSDMKESTLRTLMSRAKGNAALQAVYMAELKRRGLAA